MPQLPYTLYRACDTRALDRVAIEEFSIPGIELMNRAGGAVFDSICKHWPDARRIVVICGGGNNGGDGYVVARLAQEKGFNVTLCSQVDTAELKGDAKKAWGAFQTAGLSLTKFSPDLLQNADVIVDAILGTGLDRDVQGYWAELINLINLSDVPVVAVDIPSGLNADTGCVMGVAIKAELTISFIGLNQGLFTADAVDYCGEVLFDNLGLKEELYQKVPAVVERIDWLRLNNELTPRLNSAHKGCYGHSLLVAGNQGMAGAACLAGEAAARVGSGLTSVATRSEHIVAMAAARPEVMWQGVENAADLAPLLNKASVVAIGPGLGQDEWARQMLNSVLKSRLPVVVDADGLNLVAEMEIKHSNWVMTPHPGEAARLLGCSTMDIHQNRFQAVTELAQSFNAIVVLKGAGSLVATPEGLVSLCSDGNPGMASGGMGDVLTGIIVGLIAQQLSLYQATCSGVALHAYAADSLATEGARGYLAGGVVAALRYALNR